MPYSVILDRPKNNINVGAVLRACFNFGASSVYIIGARYKRAPSDTVYASRHLPVLQFANWDEYKAMSNAWIHIGVELTDRSESLIDFCHPKSAAYILGPEDGSLCNQALDICKYVVEVPTRMCMNLAVCSGVLMYDRTSKRNAAANRPIAAVDRNSFCLSR